MAYRDGRSVPGPAPRSTGSLDDLDRALVGCLIDNARASGADLARRLGVSESTVGARLRNLIDRGVITGFGARVDETALGYPVQAMVAVRLAGHNRAHVDSFGFDVSRLAPVRAVHNVSGAHDFLVHVACESTTELRDFVLDHITGRPGVNHVQTSMIFSTHQGPRPV